MLSGRDIVVIASEYGRYPNACEHVCRVLARSNRIIWLEMVGLRPPRLAKSDLIRILVFLQKLARKRKTPSTEDKSESVRVITPLLIPFNQFKLVRLINKFIAIFYLNRAIKAKQFHNPLFITTLPVAGDILRAYPKNLRVYYCMDEFSLWPGHNPNFIRRREQELLANVELVVATAEALQQSKIPQSGRAELLTHGVNAEHFALSPRKLSQLNVTKQSLVLCYFGLIDERLNQELLAALLREHPSYMLKMIGPVKTDVSQLKELTNVHFVGPVPYDELPTKIAEVDIFVLPYKLDDLSAFINPLKLKEYLATGRPIVATPIPEIAKLAKYLRVASTAGQFANTIKALTSGQDQFVNTDGIALARSESWVQKAQLFSQFVLEAENG